MGGASANLFLPLQDAAEQPAPWHPCRSSGGSTQPAVTVSPACRPSLLLGTSPIPGDPFPALPVPASPTSGVVLGVFAYTPACRAGMGLWPRPPGLWERDLLRRGWRPAIEPGVGAGKSHPRDTAGRGCLLHLGLLQPQGLWGVGPTHPFPFLGAGTPRSLPAAPDPPDRCVWPEPCSSCPAQ